MKIIHITDALRVGGKERQLLELLKGFQNKPGVAMEVISMSREIHYNHFFDLGIKIHFLVRQFRWDPFIFYRLYQLLKERRPDAVHSWNDMCSLYCLPVVKLLKIPLVNGFLRDAPPLGRSISIRKIRAKLSFLYSDYIVANSCSGLAAYGAPSEKSVFIHNGFDFKRIVSLGDSEQLRNVLGIKTDLIVGMVANFTDKKDYSTFLSAAQRILNMRKDVSFILVGDGPNRTNLEKSVPEDKRHLILFLGNQNEVEKIITLFDIGVLMTNLKIHGEGISNTVMEYMALAKPVVATDCGGNRELVDNEVSGYLVPDGDVGVLSCRLNQLLDDCVLSRKMGLAGKRRIDLYFNLDKMNESYWGLYSKVVNPA